MSPSRRKLFRIFELRMLCQAQILPHVAVLELCGTTSRPVTSREAILLKLEVVKGPRSPRARASPA
ncbi:uncharacterized protein RAG0_13294 [Rhynchosporium agropyri]|uniref:Uncharacterized protein n=1 Tax=Rhynchosporium agropyri TaxID=914238 RepID=A0A1E1LC73_9HELO|nr:uncharacterized protein RAG0_13294 [Rhynchosporium agropyri]